MSTDSATPSVDGAPVMQWLAGLDPVERIAAAEVAGEQARAVVGRLAAVRRRAIAEALAQGLDINVSPQVIRVAIREDRELLRAALELLRRDGVCETPPGGVRRGLAARAPLALAARGVLAGAAVADTGPLLADEIKVLERGRERAAQLLGVT